MPDASNLKGRILLVDDEQRNIGILEQVLEDYTLETARSGRETLEKLPAFSPDIVLLDIMMPSMDGYEVCRRIRRLSKARFTKVIFVSGKAFLKDRLAGYEAGGDDYLIKPFDGDELLAKVRVFLRLKHVEEILQIKTDFMDLISHETRTPLTGILGVSQILMEEVSIHGKEVADLAETIHSSGSRLLKFIDKTILLCGLKTMTGVEGAEWPIESIVEPVIESLAGLAAKSDVRVIKKLESQTLSCDAVLMGKAVTYVVENAIRFSPPGGMVEIQGTREAPGERYVITVSDQGKGIALEMQDAIFSEFAVQDIAHHGEGQGLSLATARKILELHQGSLQVRSEEGKGAAFILTLSAPKSGG